MNKAKWLLSVIVIFSFTKPYAADIAVFPVFTTNLTQAQGEAIGAIIAQQFARISSKQIIGPAETRKALDTNSNNIQAAARSLGVSEYLTINAIALQTNIIMDATLYDQMGSLQYRVQMTAGSLDDISEVSDRMARSLVYRLRLGQNVLPMKFGVDVYPYTEYDANGNPISSFDNHNYYPTEFGLNIGIGW
jgi:hypothetical protein